MCTRPVSSVSGFFSRPFSSLVSLDWKGHGGVLGELSAETGWGPKQGAGIGKVVDTHDRHLARRPHRCRLLSAPLEAVSSRVHLTPAMPQGGKALPAHWGILY